MQVEPNSGERGGSSRTEVLATTVSGPMPCMKTPSVEKENASFSQEPPFWREQKAQYAHQI